MFLPNIGKGNDRGKSGFAVLNRGAVNRGFTLYSTAPN